mgnify:CR=1 FL=1
MEKFSVKKPFTVLVAVVMILILGFVAVTKMDTNLLPNVNTPYLMVVTVYPGASPERVESEVSDVLQNSLTVPGVSKITATSAENYSLLLMEFTEDTDMNSALVKVSNKLDQAKSDLPSTCLTPSIIEYSLNMNAFMTVAVSREGADQYELSEFIQNTLVPEVQRKGGVSSVSSSGLVEKLVQVQLNQDKIDGINAKLLELIDTQLAAARSQLESAEAQITAGRKEYEKQLKNFGNTVSNSVMSQMSTEVGAAVETVRAQAQALLESVNSLIAVFKEPEIQQALIEVRDGLQKVMDKFNETGMRDIDSLIDIVAELRTITDKLTTALQKLQERVNTETGSEGSTAEDLANEMQLQESLNVVYNTLESTMQITKAMELVASSKLRRAKERVEGSRPYFETLYSTLYDIVSADSGFDSPYLVRRDTNRRLYIVIAGDRGLAGGYNSNILKAIEADAEGADYCVLPIGKKAVEHFERRKAAILTTAFAEAGDLSVSDCFEISRLVCQKFLAGEFDEIRLGFTQFVSMLTQTATVLPVLPFDAQRPEPGHERESLMMYEPDGKTVFDAIIPEYLAGVVYGALCESVASEQGARRMAMDAATKNAGEMIDHLNLYYNRARQAAITQEITEIVAGADAES